MVALVRCGRAILSNASMTGDFLSIGGLTLRRNPSSAEIAESVAKAGR